jgi:hypothetical protein
MKVAKFTNELGNAVVLKIKYKASIAKNVKPAKTDKTDKDVKDV